MWPLFSVLSATKYEQAFSVDSLTAASPVSSITQDRDDRYFLERFINQNYQRDLVTQFVRSCPYATRLGALIGKSPSMISKLKNPARYGDLQSTAQALWKWLQSNGIQGLQDKLGLTNEDIKKMKKSIKRPDLSTPIALFGSDSLSTLSDVFDLKSKTSEINEYLSLDGLSSSSTGLSLERDVNQKQAYFEANEQVSLAARCKFMKAMLMAHGKEKPSEQHIADAVELFLESAEDGDTDAIDAILALTGKTMIEVGYMARENALDLIMRCIQTKSAINDFFLQHHMIKDIVNALASMAAKNQEGNIDLVFPTIGIQNLDDGCLTVTRERFNILLGDALSFLSSRDADQIQKYIEELEIDFQKSQERALGFSMHAKLVPTAINDKKLLNDSLFNITGGLSAILSTTPDKAFVQYLREYIIEDFRTVVTFIKVMELIALKDQVSRLNSVKEQLIAFSAQWNEENVKAHLQNVDVKILESAQTFMSTIRSLIKDVIK